MDDQKSSSRVKVNVYYCIFYIDSKGKYQCREIKVLILISLIHFLLDVVLTYGSRAKIM